MPLWVPPLLAYIADAVLTLAGQPAEWWGGDGSFVREGNPLVWLLMRCGPTITLAAALLWAAAFCVILAVWKHSWAKVMAFLMTLGHGVGAGTWLVQHGWPGMVGAVGLLVLLERLLSWSWDQDGASGGSKDRSRASSAKSRSRSASA